MLKQAQEFKNPSVALGGCGQAFISNIDSILISVNIKLLVELESLRLITRQNKWSQ